MESSVEETKPVIDSSAGAEIAEPIDASKQSEQTSEGIDATTAGPTQLANEEDGSGGAGDDKEADEKMEVEADEPKPDVKTSRADTEPSVPVDESGDETAKGVEPAVEPVPEVAVKSPSDMSGTDKLSSPAPAVPAATPPRSQSSKKPKVDLTTVPVRQYLDTTVVPILLQGLSSLARERPNKPIAFLANFLLEKASEYDE